MTLKALIGGIAMAGIVASVAAPATAAGSGSGTETTVPKPKPKKKKTSEAPAFEALATKV
jgi:hypothetical protein